MLFCECVDGPKQLFESVVKLEDLAGVGAEIQAGLAFTILT